MRLTHNDRNEFAELVFLKMQNNLRRTTMSSNGDMFKNNKQIPFSERILKAAIPAASTTGTDSEDAIDTEHRAAMAFLTDPRNPSAFLRQYNDGAHPRVGVSQKTAVGAFMIGEGVNEGKAIPLNRISFAGGDRMRHRKATGLVTASNEFLTTVGPDGIVYLGGQLRAAVNHAIDASYVPEVFQGAVSQAQAGTSAANRISDLGYLMDNVQTPGDLYFLASSETANILATTATPEGIPVFPDVGPKGGSLLNLPFLVVEQMPVDSAGGSLMLMNASLVPAFLETVELQTSTAASLQLQSAPMNPGDSDYNADVQFLSLFQSEMQAMKALCSFGFEIPSGKDVAAVITGIHR
jgi:hypothetical protein